MRKLYAAGSTEKDWGLFGRRCAAYITDIVILFAVLAPTSFVVQRLLHIRIESESEIWRAAILSFSVPAWVYFILGDSARGGATIGKRLWRVRVVTQHNQRLSRGRAVARTAIKLLPWELAHLVFVASTGDAAPGIAQNVLIVAANLLMAIYLAVAALTRGRRSVHDVVAETLVVPTPR